MHGVDVVAQPHARVGDVDGALGAEPAGDRRAPAASRRRRARSSRPERRRRPGVARARSSHGATRRWSWLPATSTTSAPRASAAPIASSTGRAARERLAQRAVAQLERVAEQHEAVDAVAGARSSAPRAPGRAQDVDAGAARRGAGRETTRVRTAGQAYAARAVPRPPCDGLLVADFSRVLAGPLCTMTLGDLGADVVKVERPDGGDDTREWGPPWTRRGLDVLPRAQPQQALGRARPQGRRRPARSPSALARARRRRASSPSGPGTIDRLGLGYDASRAGNPRRRLLLDQRRSAPASAPPRCPATTCCCRR